MAQTIINATIVTKPSTGTATAVSIRCMVEMPIADYATFIATGTLTNSVPAAVTTQIAAVLAAGTIGA